MNLAKLIPSWVFVICIIANIFFAISSILLNLPDLLALNILSAVSCWIGYYLGKSEEDS